MGQTKCGPSIAKDGLRSSAHPIHQPQYRSHKQKLTIIGAI